MSNEFDRESAFPDEDDDEKVLLGIYNGVVIDTGDPLGIDRVRARIPGLMAKTGWALPMTVGGGASRRGIHAVPARDSDVFVAFLAGSEDEPVYWGAHWAEGETPPGCDGVPASERPNIRAIETPGFLVVFDDREAASLRILDKVSGSVITIAGADVSIDAPGKISIDGAQVELAGGGPGVGRVGDQVLVTIPAGAVHVTNPIQPGPPTIPSPVPIPLSGTITTGSLRTNSG